MTCNNCNPVPHDHLDHAYQSYVDEDDNGKEVILHVYSCKVCPCHTEFRGTVDDFKALIMRQSKVKI